MPERGNSISYAARIAAKPEYRKAGNSNLLELFLYENHRERVNGEWQDAKVPTEHRVTVWNGRDDSFADDLAADPDINKGAIVRIEARYKTESWKDKDGNDRISMRETANMVKVIFPPKDPLPAVRPSATDAGFIPAPTDESQIDGDDGRAF